MYILKIAILANVLLSSTSKHIYQDSFDMLAEEDRSEELIMENIVDRIIWTSEEKIIEEGYPYEEYTITTKDGYLLTLQRIPHGRGKNEVNKHSILLMPEIFSDSSMYVNMGRKASLAFILADNGYDVWLGNYRGSTLSRKHISLDPDKNSTKFWDFSFHEIGIYDTAAFIDQILKVTNTKELFYAGHGQGSTSYLVLLSEKPKYAQKIKFAVLLAPAMTTTHTTSPIVNLVQQYKNIFENYAITNNVYEVFPIPKDRAALIAIFSEKDSAIKSIYVHTMLKLVGWTPKQFNWKQLAVLSSSTPTGSSLKQILHFMQTGSGQFRQYNYGRKINLNRYGQGQPPEYNITKVSSPTAIYHGDTDFLTSDTDIKKLASKLPNLFKKTLYQGFNHYDVLWGVDAPQTVFKDILQDLKAHT